jgi:hypothetical protein
MNSSQARVTDSPTASRHSPFPPPAATVTRAPFRLTPAQAERAFVPLMALTMSGLMSLFMTAVHAGVGLQLLALWPQQWAVGFTVALPTALLVVPVLRRALARVSTVAPDRPLSGRAR